MSKIILNEEESLRTAQITMAKVAGPVKKTLGPGGQPIFIQRNGTMPDGSKESPLITKDGVTVASAIELKDPAEDTIAQAIIQIPKNTVAHVGDGTTSAIVLAEAIFNSGLKYIEKGVNNIQLYESLKTVKDQILNSLESMSRKITLEDVYEVAKISANGDEEIAEIVYKALTAVGESGYVALEDGYTKETNLVLIEGAVYKQGWRNFGPFGNLFVNNKARNTVDLENPAVLLFNGKIDDIDEFRALLENLIEVDGHGRVIKRHPLLIVAMEFSDEVKVELLRLRTSTNWPIVAIKTPFDGSPNSRTEMLEDLGVLLGATVGGKGILPLKELKVEEHLGSASKIEVSAEEVVFYKGKGDQQEILHRVEDLKSLLEITAADFDKENLRIRIGKLTGGIAIIKVGGSSELEMKERKDRIEDALCAGKVAIQNGIIPGGGYALYLISKTLPDTPLASKILKEALVAPIKQIIQNVGENPDVILSQMPENKGYDARNKVFVDLFEAGIVDPTKVTKTALENAVSIAGLLLTVGGSIVTSPDAYNVPNPLAALFSSLGNVQNS